MKVSRILSIHVVVVVVLMITPVLALQWVNVKSEKALKKNNEIYSLILIELLRIDSSLKNSRFHAYAGFMHDQNLSVAHYHAHPFSLHVDTVSSELESADTRWASILSNISSSSLFYEDILSLKQQYDKYSQAGSKPVLKALEDKDWEAIVKFVTAAIPQYSNFSVAIGQLQSRITEQAKLDYEESKKGLSKLSYSLMILYALSVITYIVFSFWLKRRIISPLHENIEIAEKISRGDLTANTTNHQRDEFGALSNAIEAMREQLSQMISSIVQESNHIENSSEELKRSSQTASQSTEKQMVALEAAESSLEQLLGSIDSLSQNAETTNETAQNAENVAKQSTVYVGETESSVQKVSIQLANTGQQVEDLSEQVKKISSITDVIQDVAAQTNLLALNAAIEAARAGEQGRGFAVVADEVRSLAATTTQSVDKISTMIADIQVNSSKTATSMQESCKEADKVVNTTTVVKESIESISETTATLKQLISEISHSLLDQKDSSNRLLESMSSTSKSSQHNNDLIENVSTMSDNLAKSSEKLKISVSGFTL